MASRKIERTGGIEGKTFFAFGGAESFDRIYRQNRISWWEEEIPTKADYNRAGMVFGPFPHRSGVPRKCVGVPVSRALHGFRPHQLAVRI